MCCSTLTIGHRCFTGCCRAGRKAAAAVFCLKRFKLAIQNQAVLVAGLKRLMRLPPRPLQVQRFFGVHHALALYSGSPVRCCVAPNCHPRCRSSGAL